MMTLFRHKYCVTIRRSNEAAAYQWLKERIGEYGENAEWDYEINYFVFPKTITMYFREPSDTMMLFKMTFGGT